eukprot:gnl/MRDRNA2_/MRDRNA2_60792_c0_seq2.p1 gnl/MRDRNA2_/MRDRNA2_60792_c0~~gnl/MRDRNA2_/MRDRNA2_60792_c0_seq2.p1  ORF type:complete len:1843 (+),score=571.54 gnl/MRDRNA2_/MRDRNA2_60792_c0_seq2:92-5620(+)
MWGAAGGAWGGGGWGMGGMANSWGQKPQQNQGGWQAQKRPASPAGNAGASAAKVTKIEKVTVSSKNPAERTKLATILGDYTVFGTNHGQQVFKKTSPVPGRPNVFAYLYYWDARDGQPMSGWWFGDQVGGNEVWAHNLLPKAPPANSSPPGSGWKTPWDGPVNPNLVVVATGTPPPVGSTPTAAKGVQKGAAKTPPGPNPQETADNKKLEEALKKGNEHIKKLETAVTATEALAKPLSAPTADVTKLDETVKKVEAQVAKAQEAVAAAQKEIATMRSESMKYHHEVKKKALTQFTELQKKISQAQLKLTPLKSAKADLEKRKVFQKTLDAIQEKVKTAEEEVAKVEKEAKSASTEEELKKIQAMYQPANNAILNANKAIDQGMKTAPATSKEALTKKKESTGKLNERIKAVHAKIKEPLDKLSAEAAMSTLEEKMKAVEEAYQQIEDAEMPFMTGIEDLPEGEHEEAVAACEKAAIGLSKATNDARNFIKVETQKCNAYVASLKTSCKESLTEAEKKNNEKTTKLTTFKKNTDERKVKGLVRDILLKIVAAEGVLKKAEGETGALKLDKLDGIDKEKVEAASAAVLKIVVEGEKACSEANKGVSQKRGAARSPALNTELGKCAERLSKVQKAIGGIKGDAQSATKVIKGKESAKDLDEKIAAAEKIIEDLESKVPAEGKELSDADTEALIEALTTAQTEINNVSKVVGAQQYLFKAGPADIQKEFKEIMDKLQARVKALRDKHEAAKKSSKAVREKLVCKKACAKAAELLKSSESALEAVTAAEDPFLRGIEVIPLKDATPAIEACEAAEKKVSGVASESRTFVSKSTGELNGFDKEIAKDALEALASVKKSIDSMGQKMGTFKKDTTERKKVVAIQKIEEKVEGVEADLAAAKKCAEKCEGSDAGCEEFETLRKSLTTKTDQSKGLLNGPRKDAAGNTLRTDLIKALSDRLAAVSKAIAELKESVKAPVEKWMAKKSLQESDEKVKEVEAALKGAKESTVVFTEQKGDSIYAYSVLRVVIDALREHMTKTETKVEDLFKKASGGKSTASKASLEKFLKSLSGLSEWFKELALPEAEVLSVVPLLGSDVNDFQGLFHTKYIVTAKVDLTEGEEVKDAKVVKELAPGDQLQSLEEPKTENGVSRVKCKAVKGGEIGWVTRGSGKQWNTKIFNASESVQKEIQDTIYSKKRDAEAGVSFIKRKIADAGQKKEGAISESKEELQKKLTAAEESYKGLQELIKSVGQAKAELSKRAETLSTSARQAKAAVDAAKVLGDSVKKAKDAEAQAAKIEELAKPLTGSLSVEDLDKVADPVGTLDAVEKALTAAREVAAATTKELKEKEATVEKDGPVAAVKAEKARLEKNLTSAMNKATQALSVCRRSCASLTKIKVTAVETAITSAAHKKGGSGDEYFAGIAGKGKDFITEAQLSKYLSSLEGLSLSAEQKKLVFKDMLCDGKLPKQRFIRIVAQYYVCMKDIGITTEFEISAKTVRKMNVGELMELLSEPKTDEASGIVRIKGRALQDGKVGWVSMKGNAGTAFLEKCNKPYLSCTGDAILYAGEPSKGEEVRKLKSHEVLEVIEGPIAEKGGDLIRIQGKAKADGKVGWLTIKDPTGAVYAEKDAKYKCVQTIALTDDLDVMKSKVIRKIEVGELLCKLEGPVTSSGASRIRGKADKDGAEGWITIKGNAGTSYVEEAASKVYSIKSCVNMHARIDAGSNFVKELKVGDVVEAMGEPKVEKIDGMSRIKCKAFSDGKEGWVLQLKGGTIGSWHPHYKCRETTSIYKTAKVAEDELVRKLDKGEGVEFLSGPQFDEAGAWAQFRADRDKTVGWVLIQDAKGKQFLGSK